jgi:hypothetical protein
VELGGAWGEGGVELGAALVVEVFQAGQVEGVVDVAAVGAAAAFVDEAGAAEQFEMVGDEVDRLARDRYQLLNAQVAFAQGSQKRPAHIVGQQFEKFGGRPLIGCDHVSSIANLTVVSNSVEIHLLQYDLK